MALLSIVRRQGAFFAHSSHTRPISLNALMALDGARWSGPIWWRTATATASEGTKLYADRSAGEIVPRTFWEQAATGLSDALLAVKRTYQPSTVRRKRKHGFLSRINSRFGLRILRRRAAKGRKRVAV
jgi:large subunit ribosomal protein L34